VADDERLPGQCVARERREQQCHLCDVGGRGEFAIDGFLEQSLSLIASALACSGICFSTRGVRTKPGQMTLARMLCGAPSLATVFASPMRPCFAVT
jgi:hypothetical protein